MPLQLRNVTKGISKWNANDIHQGCSKGMGSVCNPIMRTEIKKAGGQNVQA